MRPWRWPSLSACALLAAGCAHSASAAATRVATVRELEAAIEQGTEIIILTDHIYLQCHGISCSSLEVQSTTRAIVGECSSAPEPAFFSQTDRNAFAQPVSATEFRSGQCALLSEGAPIRTTASQLWLNNIYLFFDAAIANAIGLGTPANELFMTKSSITSTAAALLVEDGYFADVTFFNCASPERIFSTSIAGSAVFEECAFEYGAIALGLSVNSRTVVRDSSFYRTGCDAVPGGTCTGDDIGIEIPYEQSRLTEAGEPQAMPPAQLFISNSPVSIRRKTAEQPDDPVTTETLFSDDFPGADDASDAYDYFLTADDPWFIETQALYQATPAADEPANEPAAVMQPAAAPEGLIAVSEQTATAPAEAVAAPEQAAASTEAHPATDAASFAVYEESPDEVEWPELPEDFIPASTAGVAQWHQVQQRWADE